MSEATYRWGRRICYLPIWACSRAIVLHADRAALTGGYILAANHLSPLDSALLIAHTPRPIDFLGAVELRRNMAARGFLSLFNVFYVDRRRADLRAVLAIARRLREGRVVGMFPEGGVRRAGDSVLGGGVIHPGVAKIASLAHVPVIPAVVLGGSQFNRVGSWLPMRSTQYGVIFGPPLRMNHDGEDLQPEQFVEGLKHAYRELAAELIREMKWKSIEMVTQI